MSSDQIYTGAEGLSKNREEDGRARSMSMEGISKRPGRRRCPSFLPDERKSLILPGRLGFQENLRNLAMDMGKLENAGIEFADTQMITENGNIS